MVQAGGVCRPMIADLHNFDEQDPDPHHSESRILIRVEVKCPIRICIYVLRIRNTGWNKTNSLKYDHTSVRNWMQAEILMDLPNGTSAGIWKTLSWNF